jgi:hypothetical protein
MAAADGYPVRIRARGRSVLTTRCSIAAPRSRLSSARCWGCRACCLAGVSTLEGQLRRVYAQYRRQPDDLAKNVFLANMRDRNEVLFYRLLADIAIGKLAVYIAAAGLHPRRVIPVVLDMGTDNLRLPNDEMYIGNRHARIRDQRYDDLVDAYVTAASKLFPRAMLQGLRRRQRPAHPENVQIGRVHVQRRHARHRGSGAGRRIRPRCRPPAAGCVTNAWSSTVPAPPALASPT